MNMDQNQAAERILNLTMEIIYLLTGENYIVVKKSGDHVTNNASPWLPEGHCRTQSPIMDPPPVSLKHKRNSDQKILELTNEIIHLLNGEVPIRCEDVAVYFSLEEWEYLEGHKELYKEVKMVDHQPHRSLEDLMNRNTPGDLHVSIYSPDFINNINDKNHSESKYSRPAKAKKNRVKCAREVPEESTTCKEVLSHSDSCTPTDKASTESTDYIAFTITEFTEGMNICTETNNCSSFLF
ncbi:uncharacterized protein WCC33_016002 [Rhinophrynus dorsalis]